MSNPAPPLAPTSARGQGLDALRFVAAAFVVLYHLGPTAPVPLSQIWPVMDRGWLATNFFLLLSGYVLGRAYGPRLDGQPVRPWRFVSKRLQRIWPAQAAVLAGLLALVLAAALIGQAPDHPERFTALGFVSQLTLTQAWGFGGEGWNEPSWTLSALLVCYLAFPLLWRVSRRLSGGLSAALLAPLMIGAAAALSVGLLDHSLYDLPSGMGVLRALPLFAAGVLTARFAEGLRLSRASAFALAVTGLGSAAVLQATPDSEGAALASMGAILLGVVGLDLFRFRPSLGLRRAADLSFALFITHTLTGAVWSSLTEQLPDSLSESPVMAWSLWAAGLPLALAAAWLFDRVFDQPVQRWLSERRPPESRAWIARLRARRTAQTPSDTPWPAA
ncbi:acyltransferase [Brevundimonas sp. 2R-24]|uniref:Acyltransferase n=1 Tax=Peiella sedimenti TaxID=3061083 RepID=A0ABT8SIA1_9CAUL|nr:acyltransferase [Caulobacteraceae bacterium XZ-24]